MSRVDFKRRISAWLLLSVFVPAMVTASLHRHEGASLPDSAECVQCLQHLPHAGHLSQQTAYPDDCVLCHFAGLQFVSAPVATLALPAASATALIVPDIADVVYDLAGFQSTRAPPALVSNFQ